MAPIRPEDPSLLHVERISQYVSLSPASLASPLPAICASIFSPLLLSYFPAARGIVLAYTDAALSSSPPAAPQSGTSKRSKPQPASDSADDDGTLLLRHVDEYAAPFVWATASFLVFRPERNRSIAGRVTHQSTTHITLAVLNTFPVSVTQDQFPDGWTWRAGAPGKVTKGWDGRVSDEGGWWVDAEGEAVGGKLEVRVKDYEGRMDGRGKGKGLLRIEGSLVSEEVEKARVAGKKKGKAKAKVATGSADAMVVE